MSPIASFLLGLVTLPGLYLAASWGKSVAKPNWHRIFTHETDRRTLHEHHYAVVRWLNATWLMRWHFRHIGRPLCRRNERLGRGEWADWSE